MTLAPVNAEEARADTRLAWELVAQIAPLSDILRRHTMTFEQLKEKLRNPLFRSMVHETKKIWRSELNTKERIRIKAQLAVEESMLEILAIVSDRNTPASSRIDAFEKLAKIGDLTEKDKNQTTGERVNITINLGDTAKPVTITGEKA
jgi:hypothetical protein